MIRLGLSKGYIPVYWTGNLIFVRMDLLKESGMKIESDSIIYSNIIEQMATRKLRA